LNTFFRIAIYLSVVMIFFNLVIGFVGGLTNVDGDPIFPVADTPGIGNVNESSILGEVTGLEDPNMNALWVSVVGGGILVAVVLSILTRSVVPIGIHIFSTVFWTAYINCNSILSTGNFIPSGFLSIFFVGTIFLFIAALIGMLTGSG